MEKKTTDHGPIAYFCGIALGVIFGRYMPKDTTWWQDVGMFIVIATVPLIWTPKPN